MVERVAPAREMTFEEFLLHYGGKRYEYVDGRAVPMGSEIVGDDGEVMVMPGKSGHGALTNVISRLVDKHVVENDLGMVFGAETGFLTHRDPVRMRAADVAFIARERLLGIDFSDWLPVPDLAVEIVSEYDRASDLHRKVQEYLAAGVRLLWVIYPEARQVVVYRAGADAVTLGAGDALDGGDVLPGFALPISDLFTVLDTGV